ncbi:hypothetical protein [uncultured Roseobacter sp.]|uniref:hypothetical protein n=1 Tax=uncultured Roseobacter sp. TaxID=114847 RepID=UPI00260D8B53|nr:hypothetical protein [uncultured Roseobacter sp.]
MRKFFAISTAVLVCACAAPKADVKNRWNQALVNYSFVPLYPARGDVQVGDIRIHTIETAAETLDSRLVSKASENRIVLSPPRYTPAILPGIEAVRSVSIDAETSGLSGVLRDVLGTRVDASSSLFVSLGSLTTAEVADHKVAAKFYQYIRDKAEHHPTGENHFVWGLCAAAKSLGDPEFDDIGISIVTRVVRAGEITYYSGSGLTNAAGDSQPPVETGEAGAKAKLEVQKNTEGNSFTARTGSNLPKANIPGGVVVGVDALMLRPDTAIDFKSELPIAERCSAIATVFEESQARVLRKRR